MGDDRVIDEPQSVPHRLRRVARRQFGGIVHQLHAFERQRGHHGTRRETAIDDIVAVEHCDNEAVEPRSAHGAAQHEGIAAHDPDQVEAAQACRQAYRRREVVAQVEVLGRYPERSEFGVGVVDLAAVALAGRR